MIVSIRGSIRVQGQENEINAPTSAGEVTIPSDLQADIVIRTYNSASTIDRCISSVLRLKNRGRIIVVDHMSSDSTVEYCRNKGCEIYSENVGLGFATTLGIEMTSTRIVMFVDSDVEVLDTYFIPKSAKILENPKVGTVVGDTFGHPFSYGVPLGMTAFRRSDLSKIKIPPRIGGRETFFIQKYLRDNKMKVSYIRNAKIHTSLARRNKNWPEWQGSWVRISSGFNPREIIYSYLVIFLLLANSKSLRNLFYAPIFQAKFTRGFLHPSKWNMLERKADMNIGG